jgi:hypothetical protein
VLVHQMVTLKPPTEEIFSGFRDIICGRGCGHKTASRFSNLKYRLLLLYHRDLYDGAIGKNDKRLVCEMILEHIFEQGGRFVQMPIKEGPWETFSYEMCLSKVSQSFRDLRTPDSGRNTLDTATARPGTPTAQDLEAWQRLRRDIEVRISCCPSEKAEPRKPSPRKSVKRKKKKATSSAATSNRVDGKPAQEQPRAQTKPRRVSMDHGERNAREGGHPYKEENSTDTKKADEKKTELPVSSARPSRHGEWPRRVSIELGQGRSEAASASSFNKDRRDASSTNVSSRGKQVCRSESLPSAATPKSSNRSPQGDCLSSVLEISPIKPSFRSNRRVSQVTPSTTTSDSSFQSLAAQLAHFERMETNNEQKNSYEQYKAVKCTVHAAEFRWGDHEGTPQRDDSLFWDIDGSFVEINQMGYHHREGDSPFNMRGDVFSQKLQDVFFPSSGSIGEITDASSSESQLMIDDIDIAMDWFCPRASDEQSLLA